MTGSSGQRPPRAFHRFSVLDGRWEPGVRELFSEEGEEPGHAVARLATGDRIELALPAELEGVYELLLQARGPEYPEATPVAVGLVSEEGEKSREPLAVHSWWSFRETGRLVLPPGPKTLVVEVPEPAPELGLAGTEVLLRSVVVRERWSEPDRTAPELVVHYPPPGHEASGVDAVVVEAWDDERLAMADVVIDGRPQRTFGELPDGAGYVVLPLLLRDVAPGEHFLSVRLLDQEGNLAESREIPITVAAEPPPEPGRYARAVRLLQRLAYGPEPQELAEVLVRGERAWLEDALARPGAGDEAAQQAARTALANGASHYHVTRAVLQHLMRTDNPVRARLVGWVENHFSTWIQKASPGPEWREHEEFLRLGAAPFGELLVASSSSSAMLYYLDQAQSYAGQLNENYAREVMELHTLGIDGGYTQEEVTSLAGLLTGCTLSEEATTQGLGLYQTREFRFDPDLGDGLERDILGMRFGRARGMQRYDRVREALELLAAHPSTARYVGRGLAEHYVAVPAPEGLVEDLARVFTESGGDLAAVLLALAEHPEFHAPLHATGRAPRIASPLDYALRLVRTTGAHNVDWAVNRFLDRSGMGVFDRSTPDGYPEEDAAWVDTNALAQRWRLAEEIGWAVGRLVPPPLHGGAAGDLGEWRQRVIDSVAVRLTGWTLGEESNRAALDYLAGLDDQNWESLQQAAVLVCRLPEANLK